MEKDETIRIESAEEDIEHFNSYFIPQFNTIIPKVTSELQKTHETIVCEVQGQARAAGFLKNLLANEATDAVATEDKTKDLTQNYERTD